MKYVILVLAIVCSSCAGQQGVREMNATEVEPRPYIEKFVGGTQEAGVTTKFIFPVALLGEDVGYNQIYEVRFRESVAKTVYKHAQTGWFIAKMYPEKMIMSGDGKDEFGNPPPVGKKQKESNKVIIKYTDGDQLKEVHVKDVPIRPAQFMPSRGNGH